MSFFVFKDKKERWLLWGAVWGIVLLLSFHPGRQCARDQPHDQRHDGFEYWHVTNIAHHYLCGGRFRHPLHSPGKRKTEKSVCYKEAAHKQNNGQGSSAHADHLLRSRFFRLGGGAKRPGGVRLFPLYHCKPQDAREKWDFATISPCFYILTAKFMEILTSQHIDTRPAAA